MRIWEVEDNKAIPTDLVREQDFILRIRRLQRLGTPHFIINFVLSRLPALVKNSHALEDMQKRLAEFARRTQGHYAEMSNGDAFILWEEAGDTALLTRHVDDGLLPVDFPADKKAELLVTYHLPQDYAALRERANQYVEIVHEVSVLGAKGGPAGALQSEAARGPLTAWSVDQIGKLLTNIDLQPYARRQAIYKYQAGAARPWQSIAEEYFVSFEDLRRARFPKLQIITPEHLFLALCETLDHNLLTSLCEKPEILAALLGKPLHLNIAVASVAGPTFAQFTHALTPSQRANLTFELHRGDLFQDFAVTLGAIETLHHEGYKVALDVITPDMADYIDLSAFKADSIKINVSRDRSEQLMQPGIRKRLAALPPEKLVFFRCDNEKSLTAGIELGVSRFQGWLIDEKQEK